MTDHDTNKDNQPQAPSTEDNPGDPETAGETTAADTITGPSNTTPVGHDTMAKVSTRPDQAETNDD